jgi:hypothetical protein
MNIVHSALLRCCTQAQLLMVWCCLICAHVLHTLQIPEVLTALRVLMATASELDAISPQLTHALEEDKVCTYKVLVHTTLLLEHRAHVHVRCLFEYCGQ